MYCVFSDLSNFLSFNFDFRFCFCGFKYYKPVIWHIWSIYYISWLKGLSSVGVIMTSRVRILLHVGNFTHWVRLNATSESRNICASWSSMLPMCMLISPSMIMFLDPEDNSVRRSMNWSKNVELLSFASQLDGGDGFLLWYRLALIWTIHSMFCVQSRCSC